MIRLLLNNLQFKLWIAQLNPCLRQALNRAGTGQAGEIRHVTGGRTDRIPKSAFGINISLSIRIVKTF
jgi:hypothetical protein